MSRFDYDYRYGGPIFFWVSTLLLIIAIVTDYVIAVKGMPWSNQLCVDFQEYKSNFVIRSMQIVSYIPFMAVLFILLHPWRADKFRSYMQMILLLFNSYFFVVLKLAYADSRPYAQNKDIVAYECECTFGKPSGHAIMATTFSMLVAIQLTEIKVIKKGCHWTNILTDILVASFS